MKQLEENALVHACVYNILFTNDVTCSAIIEAVELLKKSKLYKQRTKQLCNQIGKERKKYERRINEIISKHNQDFFADANDTIMEAIGKDLDILYYQFKSTLDKQKVSDSHVLAKLELASAMAQLSVQSWERRINDMSKEVTGVRERMMYLRLSSLETLFKELICSIHVEQYVNFNTEQANMAMEIIMKKLVNGELIAKAMAA